MKRTGVVASMLFVCVWLQMSSPCIAELLGPGRYHGYVGVDRWGQKVFHTGPYHLFLADGIFEKLKSMTGSALELHVTNMHQPHNPGGAMIREFSKVQVKQLIPGLEIQINCPQGKVKRGRGLSVGVSLKNTSRRVIEVHPGAIGIVLVTNTPTSNKAMGYHDPDDCAYWYYHSVYLGLGADDARKEVACRRVIVDWTPQVMADKGAGVSIPKEGWGKVLIAPGGAYAGSATVGKLLLPGEYQVFAYYASGNFSNAAGPMSRRMNFDVGGADANKLTPARAGNIQQELIRQIFIHTMSAEHCNSRLASFRDRGKDLDIGASPEETIQRAKHAKEIMSRRIATLRLGFCKKSDTILGALVELLADSDGLVQLNAARGLAYHGRREGVPLLKKVAAGEMVLSSSEFERERAAWALLSLGEKFARPAKPYYSKVLNELSEDPGK